MKISELIEELQALLKDHGNLPVYSSTGTVDHSLDKTKPSVQELWFDINDGQIKVVVL